MLVLGEVPLAGGKGGATAHIIQSRPDSGVAFQVKVLVRFEVLPRFCPAGVPADSRALAHIRQSRLDYGLLLQVKVLKTFQGVPSLLLGRLGAPLAGGKAYRGTSLIRNRPTLGPYSRPMPRALWLS